MEISGKIIVRPANLQDEDYLKGDLHLKTGLDRKIAAGEIYVMLGNDLYLGWLRFNYFWDAIPFINLLQIEKAYRRNGLGRKLVQSWEEVMRAEGWKLLMTSSLADESAQHFWRKIGYLDSGALLLPREPLEIIFQKEL